MISCILIQAAALQENMQTSVPDAYRGVISGSEVSENHT